MITVTNEKEIVKIKVELGIGFNISAEYLRNHEMDAILLRREIQKELDETIKEIRREAYEQGWRDNRKGVAKKIQTFFTGITTKGVGY